MGASLKAGLAALGAAEGPVAALVHLVDLPWVGPDILVRVAREASTETVARAAYDGVPGHPVLLGRRWWAEIADTARGDRGARDWLAGRGDLRLVECGDLGSGRDVDRRADLPGR
jgi:nicotine blue oxidoreductase